MCVLAMSLAQAPRRDTDTIELPCSQWPNFVVVHRLYQLMRVRKRSGIELPVDLRLEWDAPPWGSAPVAVGASPRQQLAFIVQPYKEQANMAAAGPVLPQFRSRAFRESTR
jgi:hypothetical protein